MYYDIIVTKSYNFTIIVTYYDSDISKSYNVNIIITYYVSDINTLGCVVYTRIVTSFASRRTLLFRRRFNRIRRTVSYNVTIIVT